MSFVLLLGRIRAAAQIRPVSSVAREKNLLHLALRRGVDADAVAVGNNRVNHILRHAAVLQQLHAFDAVLLGVQLKIDIVQQTHDAPVVCLRAVTQIVCEPSA